MPVGVIDGLRSFMDFHEVVDGIDFRRWEALLKSCFFIWSLVYRATIVADPYLFSWVTPVVVKLQKKYTSFGQKDLIGQISVTQTWRI